MGKSMLKRKAQTILEYTILVCILLGVLVAMQNYIKRGIQGRWKSATDDLGDQYSPDSVNSDILYSTQANSQTIVAVFNGIDWSNGVNVAGQWTNRVDYSNSVETKTGNTQVGN